MSFRGGMRLLLWVEKAVRPAVWRFELGVRALWMLMQPYHVYKRTVNERPNSQQA